MLPKSYQQQYQILRQTLEKLMVDITRSNPQATVLQVAFLETQQLFHQRIMSLNSDELDAAIFPRVQSIQTEINKQLRLLGMDVMFLQTARQPVTIQQRQAQMRDRVQLLIRYCQVLLGEEGEGEG